MAGTGLTPGRTMGAEDIHDFQLRARHARRSQADSSVVLMVQN
jgi:hypothetical protein